MMTIPKPEDAKHKNEMFRLLRELLSNALLSNELKFKGGTYAALAGYLDRFSVDLDFDLPDKSKKDEIRQLCYGIFSQLNLEIKDESNNHLEFFLKYDSRPNTRNTLKLEINDDVSPNNGYEKVYLREINMYCNAHDVGTMFANKLVAARGRFVKNNKLSGRDFYDIHAFFLQALPINKEVVEERTGVGFTEYLALLVKLIEDEVNDEVLYSDLNPLLSSDKLSSVVKNLKPELLVMLNDEIVRVSSQSRSLSDIARNAQKHAAKKIDVNKVMEDIRR